MAFNPSLLDTRIPLTALANTGRAGVAVLSPDEQAQQREQTRNTKAVADLNTRRLSDSQRAAARQQLLESTFARHNGDWEATEREVSSLDPELGLKIRKGRFDAQQSMHQEFQERMAAERAGADMASSFVRMVKQAPELYPALRQAIASRLPDDVEAALPAEYDEAALTVLEEAAVPAKEAMARAERNHKLVLSGDWQQGLFGQLADADDEAEWNNIVSSYLPFLPAGARAMIPAWSEDAPDKVARIVMGPDAVIDNDRADARDAVLARQGDARVAIAGRRAAQAGSGGSGAAGAAGGLVDAVMANPTLFAGLTPSDRAKIIPALQAKGFDFGTLNGGDGKPSTGAEKTALGFFNRAKQADDDLRTMETEIAGQGLAGQVRMQVAPNWLQTQTGQAYTQAQRAFTEARLRKDSGAAIPNNEFESDRQTYFAQPGDSAATLEQKRRARAAVLASMGFQSGRALREFYGDDAGTLIEGYRGTAARPQGGGQAGGEVVVTAPNGKRYKFPNQAAADAFARKAGGR